MEVQAKQSPPVPWRRRLFRFSLRRLLLLVLLCALGFGWPHVWRLIQFQRLKGYAGQDLRQLSEPERARFAAIAKTVSNSDSHARLSDVWFHERWYAWQTTAADGESLTILIDASHDTTVRVRVLGWYGRVLRDSWFLTGRVSQILAVKHNSADRMAFDCIELRTLHDASGGPMHQNEIVRQQHYAVIGRDLVLVRLQDSQGRACAVNYGFPSDRIGPEPPARSDDQWAAALGSQNQAEVLRTLVWLGGFHLNPPVPNPGTIGIESFEEASQAARVRARADVQAALQRLAADPDSWVSEAAQAALDESAVTTDPSN